MTDLLQGLAEIDALIDKGFATAATGLRKRIAFTARTVFPAARRFHLYLSDYNGWTVDKVLGPNGRVLWDSERTNVSLAHTASERGGDFFAFTQLLNDVSMLARLQHISESCLTPLKPQPGIHRLTLELPE